MVTRQLHVLRVKKMVIFFEYEFGSWHSLFAGTLAEREVEFPISLSPQEDPS